MKNKIKNLYKLVISIITIFIFTNFNIIPESFAAGGAFHPVIATIIKGAITFIEVLVAGYFTIRFTITGIQYFTATAVSDKLEKRNKLYFTLLYGVLAYLGIFLFSYAVGL